MTIKKLPKVERPREKMILYGSSALSLSELLAVLIRTGDREKTAVGLGNDIISFDGDGLKFLANCTPEELMKIKGVGQAKACQIVAAIELGKHISTRISIPKNNLTSPEKVSNIFMEEMRYYDKERFKVAMLDIKGHIIYIEEISVGDLNSSLVHPREVFKSAIKKSAASIILVHNHPSGNPNPSTEDIEITKRLQNAGKLLGIEVLDHIIIGDGDFVSLKKEKLI